MGIWNNAEFAVDIYGVGKKDVDKYGKNDNGVPNATAKREVMSRDEHKQSIC